jgi:hypothetical protein
MHEENVVNSVVPFDDTDPQTHRSRVDTLVSHSHTSKYALHLDFNRISNPFEPTRIIHYQKGETFFAVGATHLAWPHRCHLSG